MGPRVVWKILKGIFHSVIEGPGPEPLSFQKEKKGCSVSGSAFGVHRPLMTILFSFGESAVVETRSSPAPQTAQYGL